MIWDVYSGSLLVMSNVFIAQNFVLSNVFISQICPE
jgi:hypothetical protein